MLARLAVFGLGMLSSVIYSVLFIVFVFMLMVWFRLVSCMLLYSMGLILLFLLLERLWLVVL